MQFSSCFLWLKFIEFLGSVDFYFSSNFEKLWPPMYLNKFSGLLHSLFSFGNYNYIFESLLAVVPHFTNGLYFCLCFSLYFSLCFIFDSLYCCIFTFINLLLMVSKYLIPSCISFILVTVYFMCRISIWVFYIIHVSP